MRNSHLRLGTGGGGAACRALGRDFKGANQVAKTRTGGNHIRPGYRQREVSLCQCYREALCFSQTAE